MISIDFDQFCQELFSVIDKPRPWMHARFGDGEGIVMGYPEYTSNPKARKRWTKWIGANILDMQRFAKEIREAVKMCDIVGIPCKRHQTVNQDWRNVKLYMEKFNLLRKDQKVCCMDCTIDLQRNDLFKELFENLQEVYCITCRDVEQSIRDRFHIPEVNMFFLPPQHRPYKGKVMTTTPHFPARFVYLRNTIFEMDIKNKVFLVGAGGLGKIYCKWIKQKGGIALDIGSIFDGWAGLQTRSYLKNIKEFTL